MKKVKIHPHYRLYCLNLSHSGRLSSALLSDKRISQTKFLNEEKFVPSLQGRAKQKTTWTNKIPEEEIAALSCLPLAEREKVKICQIYRLKLSFDHYNIMLIKIYEIVIFLSSPLYIGNPALPG